MENVPPFGNVVQGLFPVAKKSANGDTKGGAASRHAPVALGVVPGHTRKYMLLASDDPTRS